MEAKDWTILNNIIYNIHTVDDFNKMRYEMLNQLKMIFDYDSAVFFMASKQDENVVCDPVTFNCDIDSADGYESIAQSKEMISGGKTIIYKETDIIPDEERVETDYYKKVYKPNNWHYSLNMVIAYNKKCVGVVTFYRTIGKDNFQYEDIFVLDMLKDHLAYRLNKHVVEDDSISAKLSIREAVEKYHLTKREDMVLHMLMLGKDNDIICNELGITTNTLKKHILNIYRKLGIKNRVQLFKMVKENS